MNEGVFSEQQLIEKFPLLLSSSQSEILVVSFEEEEEEKLFFLLFRKESLYQCVHVMCVCVYF